MSVSRSCIRFVCIVLFDLLERYSIW